MKPEEISSIIREKIENYELTTKLVQFYFGLRLMHDVSEVRKMVKDTRLWDGSFVCFLSDPMGESSKTHFYSRAKESSPHFA